MQGWSLLARERGPVCGCERRLGGRGIFLFTGSKDVAEQQVRVSEAGSCLITDPDCPATAFVLCAGYRWGSRRDSICPCPPDPGVGTGPSGLPALFTRYMHLFIENLYSSTSSRVIFVQWEHSEVTSC